MKNKTPTSSVRTSPRGKNYPDDKLPLPWSNLHYTWEGSHPANSLHLQVQDSFYFTDNSSVAPISAGLRPRHAKLHPTSTEREQSQAARDYPERTRGVKESAVEAGGPCWVPIFDPISAPPTARAPRAAVPAWTPAHYCSPRGLPRSFSSPYRSHPCACAVHVPGLR